MFLASVGYERKKLDGETLVQSLGKIWFDEERHRCSIHLTGFHQGMFIAKIYDSVEKAPYISGDLCYPTGEYSSEKGIKKTYQWCGHIQSTQSESGETTYWGLLEVLPIPSSSAKAGVWLTVFLDSYEPAKGENDGMPF